MPFFESTAKNVGLRRAQGTYWLVTNPDVLFSNELFRELAPHRLSPGFLYRTDRYDVAFEVPEQWAMGQQLAFCARHIDAWHGLHASVRFPRPWRLGRAMERTQRKIRAEYERFRHNAGRPGPHYEQFIFPADGIHTNASGCFLLMHRRHWEQIRGQPEIHTRGHADAITCWSAFSAGVEQLLLHPPCLMFHQPHSRSAQSGWIHTDWHPWYERFQAGLESGQPLIINGPDWGFAGEDLEEWVLEAGPSLPAWRCVRAASAA
jgi:hypothetical protein